MNTITYYEFLNRNTIGGLLNKLKHLKIDMHELICLFTIDKARAVNLETMQIIGKR